MNDDAEYAGRLLADRYRLPQLPPDAYETTHTRAYDTVSGQEVLVRQVPLPEIVDADLMDDRSVRGPGHPAPGPYGAPGGSGVPPRATRRPADPAVRRAVEAALAASHIPDHPHLDQVFDVFVDGDGLWIVSELVPARPLATFLAERSLGAHRAAEIAADLLAALRSVHAHGWVHRNITTQTVLVCDDGRAVLTGLAAGAAEEALSGYDPLPDPSDAAVPRGAIPFAPTAPPGMGPDVSAPPGTGPEVSGLPEVPLPEGFTRGDPVPVPEGDPRLRAVRSGLAPQPGAQTAGLVTGAGAGANAGTGAGPGLDKGLGKGLDKGRQSVPGAESAETGGGADARAVRRSAIAAYHAGAQAAHARVEAEAQGRDAASPPVVGRTVYGPQGRPFRASQPPRPPAPGEAVPVEGQPWSGEGPTALPGPRRGESRPVPTPWATGSVPRTPERAAAPAPVPVPVPEARPEPEPEPELLVGYDDLADDRYRGPATSLAAERARQARMTLVGAITERWAPEQAGPVYENWRLAPPVGPAADLWALGALLFRAVQGHAPYPEDSVTELVQMVCSEPPAFAEECGALRPVVESLMRQDPTERPDFEELRGWLRSLIRSAPEPDIGLALPDGQPPLLEPGGPADPHRLPIKRRRGELVRRRRARKRARAAAPTAPHQHREAAHPGTAARDEPHHEVPPPRAEADQGPGRGDTPARNARRRLTHDRGAPGDATPSRKAQRPPRARKQPVAREPREREPRNLGKLLLGGVMVSLGSVVAYAVWFMPQTDGPTDPSQQRGSVGQPETVGQTTGSADPSRTPRAEETGKNVPVSPPVGDLPAGFRLHQDGSGFAIAVPEGWEPSPANARGQVRFSDGQFEMVVVKGRDSTQEFGTDPMAYQSEREPELGPFRTSAWSSAASLRRIDVGDTAMAEGTYTWKDASGREVYVRNRAMILGGRYHLVLVLGPSDERASVDRYFEGARDTYRVLTR